MADEVKIPITLDVTDLDISKVNTKDLEKGMKQNLEGIRKAFDDIMKTVDTTHVSKEFSKAATSINTSFRSAESAVKNLSKSISDLDKGAGTMKNVEKSAEDVVTAFKKITDEYGGFASSANTETVLTPQFRNALSTAQEMTNELKAYTAWTEKASAESGTTSEYWEQLEIYTKSAKANIQSMLADLREMVKSGEAFKLGKDEESSSEYMHMLKSLQGTAQANFNRANFLFGGSGNSASSDLIAARTEVDRLSHSLELAKMNLETMMRGERTTNPQIEAMQTEIQNMVTQLAEAEARYNELYEAAYGVAEATQEAATATVELEAASSGASSGLQISDAMAISLSESLNTIIELLGEVAARGGDVGDSMEDGMERGSNATKKSTNNAKELREAFSSARNVMTATIMTLQQFGSVGTIIAQVIGIVQLLADAFRDVATAAHSVIPIIGLFLGLAINIFGRIISILKKILALLKQIGLAILSVAQKITGKLASGIKKLAGLFKSLIPSMTTIRKLLRKITQYFLGFRSAYFLIRKVRQAVIDGMKDIAANAPEVNEYMSNFSTALNQLKGSLTGAFEPIMSVVIPALTRLMEVLAKVLTYIAKFNAVLVGRDYYYDYAAAMQDYANGIGGVGKAAKKAQKDLMGFDEINRLSAPNEPSGSGGSGLGGTFTKSEIDMENAISKFAEMVKKAWKESDFTEVGSYIGHNLSNLLKHFLDEKTFTDSFVEGLNNATGNGKSLADGIDTVFGNNTVQGRLKKTAENIAKDFATFINGFVETPQLGEDLGKAIASLFNTAFTFLYKFATEVHWDSVGRFVGDGIASALENFDWEQFFSTFVKFINGLAEMIENAVKGHDWLSIGGQIGDGLVKSIMKFDAAKAGKAVSDFFMALLNLIKGFVDKMTEEVMAPMDPYRFGGQMKVKKSGWTILGDKVKQFFLSMDVEDLGATAGETLGKIINGMIQFLTAADFSDVTTKFFDKFFESMDKTMWYENLKAYWEDTLWPTIERVIEWLKPYVIRLFEMLWDLIKTPLADLAKKIGTALVDGIKDAIIDALTGTPVKGFEKAVANVAEFFGTSGPTSVAKNKLEKERQQKGIQSFIESLTDDEIEKLRRHWDKLSKGAQENLQNYSDQFDDLDVKTASSTVNITSSYDKIGDSAKDTSSVVDTALSKMSTSATSTTQVFTTGFNTMQEVAESSMSAIEPAAAKAYKGVTGEFDQLVPYMEQTTGAAVNAFFASLQPGGELAQGLAIATNSVVKTSVNRMVDGINTYAMNPLISLANMLEKLRTLSLGGITPFASLPKFNFFRIPKLAQGAVLPPNQPFLSVVGDQKSGTNVEAPLETIKQAVAEVMGDNYEGMMAGFEAVVRAIQNKDLSVTIGDRDIGQANDRYNQRLATMRGV